jgi:PAS domain S-box-containing protein
MTLMARKKSLPNLLQDRARVAESMKIGWMVLDLQGAIVDANPFIEVITGKKLAEIRGQRLQAIVAEDAFAAENICSQTSARASVNINGFNYYFDISNSPVLDENGESLGCVLLWKDVTEQRRLEDALYRKRAEQVNLMRSISAAANHITDMGILLEAAIFQIVSSFGAQAGFVFTRDSEILGDDKAGFRLSAAYSYDTRVRDEELLADFGHKFHLFAQEPRTIVLKNVPILAIVSPSDSQINELLGEFILCPITVDRNFQGVLCLYRADYPFAQDEIGNLEMLSNELSMLMFVDYQRRQAISFSERKKLVKDLHDTVTQQLYALLYQIEIAQAKVEYGQTENMGDGLAKIGNSARQALREMRLFLHELQPFNFKEEGLISALHRRLTAVEGRANVQYRFLAPEQLDLPIHQQMILFQIAREALNNALRHAFAKNISVQLEQFENEVVLEITDDGVGFDVQAYTQQGGMGLANIKEMAEQIHAQLELSSKPGDGFALKVRVARSQFG